MNLNFYDKYFYRIVFHEPQVKTHEKEFVFMNLHKNDFYKLFFMSLVATYNMLKLFCSNKNFKP